MENSREIVPTLSSFTCGHTDSEILQWVSFSEPTYPGYDADINPQLTALSISSVVYDHTVASCTFVGVDSGKAVADEVVEANGGQLGPPQTITEVSCTCICD